MLLSELFDQLTFGELSQIYVAGRDEIGIQAADYEKIIPHINLGLTELHKRFEIKTNTLTIQQDPSIEVYHLNSRYALANDGITPEPKYILDSVGNPFIDDVLKIIEIKDSYNNTLTLNDDHNYKDISSTGDLVYVPTLGKNDVPVVRTIYTPTPLSLKSTYSSTNMLWTVKYRANHKKLSTYDLDLSSEQIDISPSFLQPLLYFIAARIFESMSEQDGTMYYQKYENACHLLASSNSLIDYTSTNNKLDERGFI